MADIIQFKRGPKKALPTIAAIGEPLYCTDTNEIYVGTANGPRLIANIKTIDCGIFGDGTYDPERDSHYDGGTF